MSADPKPAKRVVDPKAKQRKLAEDPMCRCGCGRRATDGHHILFGMRRHDDVEDNIMPLYHDCHMKFHAGQLKELELRPAEKGWLARRMGTQAAFEYMHKRFG
jgi:hypothetical protein